MRVRINKTFKWQCERTRTSAARSVSRIRASAEGTGSTSSSASSMSSFVGAFKTSVVREGGGPSVREDEDADVAKVANRGRVVTSLRRVSLTNALRQTVLDVVENINGRIYLDIIMVDIVVD